MSDYIQSLDDKIWTTKKARYNANYRLVSLASWSKQTLGFLSAYVIIINILNIYLSTKNLEFDVRIIPVFTTGIAILILVFSQSEGAKQFELRASKILDSAKLIDSLHNELKYLRELDLLPDNRLERVNEIQVKYNSILSKYDNHEPYDYKLVIADNHEFFKMNRFEAT